MIGVFDKGGFRCVPGLESWWTNGIGERKHLAGNEERRVKGKQRCLSDLKSVLWHKNESRSFCVGRTQYSGYDSIGRKGTQN